MPRAVVFSIECTDGRKSKIIVHPYNAERVSLDLIEYMLNHDNVYQITIQTVFKTEEPPLKAGATFIPF